MSARSLPGYDAQERASASAELPAPERIVAAAHLYQRAHDDGDPRALPVIVSAPPPARHHNLFIAWTRFGGPTASGFLTSAGRFVDRREGWTIATAAGQPMIPREGQGGHLFSEDLW